MINLIKNELTKIFSKKAIYVYTFLILSLVIGVCLIGKKANEEENSNFIIEYTESLENGLDSYNLSNEEELRWYIGDRTIIDINKLAIKYKSNSAEKYYIDNTIEPIIQEKYKKEYIDKDQEGLNQTQIELDKAIEFLNKFDWKKQITDEKKIIEENIKELENLLANNNDGSIQKSIEGLKLELWCLNYRLENKIPYSYKEDSMLVDEYKHLATQYVNLKDEKLIKNKNELLETRLKKGEYKKTLYELEHHIFSEDKNTIDYIVECMTSIDAFIIIAIIIISGSIISEEFNKGTIKQLLTKPYSRGKILTSKIIASLIAITIFVILYQTVFIIANCYETNSFNSLFGTNVIYDFNLDRAREVSVLSQCIYGFISTLPAYLIIFILIIFIGIVSTNAVATTVIGFGAFIGGDLLQLWLNPKILSFIPLCTWNLSSFMYGGMNYNTHITFGKSLLIDISTIFIFTLLSYVTFKRKEIKNQ